MRIINHTRYQSKQIRYLVTAVAKRELMDASYRKMLTVVVKHRKTNWHVLGRGSYKRAWIALYLDDALIDPVQLAYVIAHEIAHTQGVHHSGALPRFIEMTDKIKDAYAWAKTYPIEHAPDKSKPAKDPMLHAQMMRDKWIRKVKQAQNKLRKWDRSVKYYERKMVASKTNTQETLANIG